MAKCNSKEKTTRQGKKILQLLKMHQVVKTQLNSRKSKIILNKFDYFWLLIPNVKKNVLKFMTIFAGREKA